MRFVYKHQEAVRKEIKQHRRTFALLTSAQMAGVILYSRAVAHFFQHFEVIFGPRLQAFCFQVFSSCQELLVPLRELDKSEQLVEQIIRPTGLLDPEIKVRPTEGQIDDLVAEIKKRINLSERTLVITLTKKMAEDLSEYLSELGLRVRYLHSEVETIERVEILKSLRTGEFDVLVGINLLREGLDLPEVSFIAILDADKIGFLRSSTSLIQIIGRAARHINGQVIMYADKISAAMTVAINETERRREIQDEHNRRHGVSPKSITKSVQDLLIRKKEEKRNLEHFNLELMERSYNLLIPQQKKALIKALEKEMLELAINLEFERAAVIRDEITRLKDA